MHVCTYYVFDERLLRDLKRENRYKVEESGKAAVYVESIGKERVQLKYINNH